MDVELLLQAGGLISGAKPGLRADELAMSGWLNQHESEIAIMALNLYHKVQQVSRLAVQGIFDPATSGTGAAQLLARTCGYRDIGLLENALDETRKAMAGLIRTKLEEH